MTPGRWQQIRGVFGSAIERAPVERAAFVKEVCAGDEDLLREVESLLASYEQDKSFLEAPAFRVADEIEAADREVLSAGQTIGHYEVISLIGEGGMGEVYLAHDTRLGRRVALKLLPARFTTDRDRLRRFDREAQAASKLSHPNVCTIHEVGETDEGRHYIVIEYVEGVALREHIAGGRLSVNEVLSISVQIATALAAAHEAGIIHRDIKPENVIIKRDGLVKVLDFGLAKLAEHQQGVDLEAATKAQVKTDTGLVMGTPSYMSPEQTQGAAVDHRTDIWSLGVVLYEMITGHLPFEGATASHVIVSILEKRPPPLAHFRPGVPAELQRIVGKALRKDREERYQTMKDMALDLKNLRRELEIGAELEAAAQSSAEGGGHSAAASTASIGGSPTASRVEYAVSGIKRHKRGVALVTATLIIALGGLAFGLYRFVNWSGSTAVPFQAMNVTRFTATGKAVQAAVSPDGKYVVYTIVEGGRHSLWVRQVATQSNVQIVPPAEGVYSYLTFSHDGNYVYYTSSGVINKVPTLGGAPKKLAENVRWPSSVAPSPDGKRLVFARFEVGKGKPESTLFVVNDDGTGEQKLPSPKLFIATSLAWSPDGKVIACAEANNDEGGTYFRLLGVKPEDGSSVPISSKRWNDIGLSGAGIAWLADGSGLIVAARDQQSSTNQIWQISYPGGEAQRITNDLHDYSSVSLTADSQVMAAIQNERVSHIWVAPEGDAGRAKQISAVRNDGIYGLSWEPDGRIVYASSASGNENIWMMDADGRNQRQLTNDTVRLTFPVVTPDGRYLVFILENADGRHIWRMYLDGSDRKQLTHGIKEAEPRCSPDGKWVVYYGSEPDSGEQVLWRVSIDGGNPVQITERGTALPDISPDGKLIAHYLSEDEKTEKIAVTPFEGGAPLKTFDFEQGNDLYLIGCRWASDGRALTYIVTRNGVSNIWSQPFEGGPPQQVTHFQSDQIYNFEWSRDGKQVALARGTENNDVVLISNFR